MCGGRVGEGVRRGPPSAVSLRPMRVMALLIWPSLTLALTRFNLYSRTFWHQQQTSSLSTHSPDRTLRTQCIRKGLVLVTGIHSQPSRGMGCAKGVKSYFLQLYQRFCTENMPQNPAPLACEPHRPRRRDLAPALKMPVSVVFMLRSFAGTTPLLVAHGVVQGGEVTAPGGLSGALPALHRPPGQ